ncbi:MAG: flagellin FliC [Myxococcales bacterium]|nr:flagellin FliC [Myxococcales bacterium]
MGLRINTNVASLNAQRNLARTSLALRKTFERLSSGLRINRAADDPAGLALSEGLRARIRSMEQAERNALDGISLVQVGEGALAETADLLIRMRELAVQAANGTLSDADRSSLRQEFQASRDEIDRIAAVTDFGGVRLLDGGASIYLQIGAQAGEGITVSGVDARADALGITGLGVSSAAFAQGSLSGLDDAIRNVATLRASFGTAQNRIESAIRTLRIAIEATSAAESRIRDADLAYEISQLSRHQVLLEYGASVLAQANLSPAVALQLLPLPA